MISGAGSNLQALLDAVAAGDLRAQVAAVVSNRRGAYGLTRAEQAGIPALYFPLKTYKDAGKSREDYDSDLAKKVAAYQPDLIVLAGWMHVLSPAFLDHFAGKVVNLHPALPGEFAGINAIERALEAYRRNEISTTGCMVHYVIPEVDAGPVIAQAAVPIEPDDTLETLQARMQATEHRLIVQAVQQALNSTG
jgi:formyltetrahydrofolate-dependent phosphoribosylglycinamide formyltransferase